MRAHRYGRECTTTRGLDTRARLVDPEKARVFPTDVDKVVDNVSGSSVQAAGRACSGRRCRLGCRAAAREVKRPPRRAHDDTRASTRGRTTAGVKPDQARVLERAFDEAQCVRGYLYAARIVSHPTVHSRDATRQLRREIHLVAPSPAHCWHPPPPPRGRQT